MLFIRGLAYAICLPLPYNKENAIKPVIERKAIAMNLMSRK